MDDQQSQQPINIQPNSYQMPINQFENSIRILTDPNKDLIDIEMSLKGQIRDSEGNIADIGDPLCNDKGVASIMRMARSMVGRVNIMSNFEEDDIRKLTMYLATVIIRDLMFNRKQYDIKSNSARHQIVQIVVTKCFAAGMRALENGERRWLKGSQQEIIMSQQQQQKKGGFWESVKSSFK